MSQVVPLPEIFGRNVAARREQLHLQQNELALRLGVTQDTLSRIEHGKNFPKTQLIEKLAKEFNCTESELFLRETAYDSIYAASICSFLKPLSPEAQKAIVSFVEFLSHVLLNRQA